MKTMRTLIGAAAGLALSSALWAATPASPVTPTPHAFTLWQGGSANLPEGQSFASAFDIRLLLDPVAERVSTAVLTLSFMGSGERNPQPLGTTTIPGYYWPEYSVGLADTYTYYADPLDSVVIRVGQWPGPVGQASDAAGLHSTSVVTSTTPVYGWRRNCQSTGIGGQNCYYVSTHLGDNYTYDRLDGYKGAFSFSTDLDAATINDMSSSGLLRYAFTVNAGGAALESASLMFTTSPVPEPATGALSVAGLLVVVGRTLSRRRCRSS